MGPPAIGTVVERGEWSGYFVEKRVARIAYPRNGNVHNPTVYYRWDVRDKGGRLVLVGVKTRAAARAYATACGNRDEEG